MKRNLVFGSLLAAGVLWYAQPSLALQQAELTMVPNPSPSVFSKPNLPSQHKQLSPLQTKTTAMGEKILQSPVTKHPDKKPLFKEGEVIVKLKKTKKIQSVKINNSALHLEVKKKLATLSQLKGQDILVVKSPSSSAKKMVAVLSKDPNVEVVTLNYLSYTNAVPSDGLFSLQWALENTGQINSAGYPGTAGADIKATSAWDIQTGSNNTVVAVLDTGVAYSHSDLSNNMWVNQQELDGVPGIDDDFNGYVDDIYGIDTGEGDSDPLDHYGHGTHVAGTIAAVGNDGFGIAGINWQGKVMAVKGFPDNAGLGLSSAAELEAIDYIINMKARGVNIVAINASYGGSGQSQIQQDAIEAAGAAGIIFVAAAGNEANNNDTTPSFPNSYGSANIISVAATDNNDLLAGFSNYGVTSVDLAAPGDLILSTYFWNEYLPAPGDLFYDSMESGDGNWLADVTWANTTESAASPTHSWSDSPNGEYVNNAWSFLFSRSFDLASASVPLALGFKAKYFLEAGWDFLDIYFYNPPTPSLWQRTTESHYSGSTSWSDSPGGYYPDNLESWLVSPVIDLSSGQDSASLSFMFKGNMETGYDQLHIYLSADGGAQWADLGYLSGDYSQGWYLVNVDIPVEYRTNQFRIAFVSKTDSSVTYDGYYIDDIVVTGSTTTFFFDDTESGTNGWISGVSGQWDFISSISGSSGGDWDNFSLNIDPKYFRDGFQVAFGLSSDSSVTYDGVYLDDVGIGTPTAVNGWSSLSGTSMATPHVTGAVALMAAQHPEENVSERVSRILTGVDPLPTLAGLVGTGGRLNLFNSLGPVVYSPPVIDDINFDSCISECPTCPDANISATATDPEGGTLTYSWNTVNSGSIVVSGPTVQFDPPDSGPHASPYQVQLTVTSSASGLTASQTIDISVHLTADTDANGVVNLQDKVRVKNHFGQSVGHPSWDPAADVDCNGVVNVADKVKVSQQFGQSGNQCP